MDRWDENSEIGVSSIDEQHRGLWQLVNQLDEHTAAGPRPGELRTLFENLRNQTEIHFLHEEQYFGPTKFPRATQHKREHDRLLLILKRLHQGLAASAVPDSRGDLVRFLRGWLAHHIESEDRPLATHLNSLGIR